jgi:hypothetical protein
MHVLAVGMCYTGKSTLFRKMAEVHKKQGRGTVVYDPQKDEKWLELAQCVMNDGEKYFSIMRANKNRLGVVDDALHLIGHNAKELTWLATQSRHNGHIMAFGVQRVTKLDPIFRDNCTYIYGFHCTQKSADLLAEDYNCKAFEECPELPYGTAIYYDKMRRETKKITLFEDDNRRPAE